MIHEVSGSNLHGQYTITLRGPAEGFELSPAQARRVAKATCGVKGCRCGGSLRYGEGPDESSARVIEAGWERRWYLIPAPAAVRDEYGFPIYDEVIA